MADDEAAYLAEAKKRPFEARVADSNWKVRSACYEDAKARLESAYGGMGHFSV
jgi:hypothetical protein